MTSRSTPPLITGTSRSASIPPIVSRIARPAKASAPPSTKLPARTKWKYLEPRELKALKNLLFAARIVVEGIYAGRHKSPYRGSSPEFVDYREYNPGDEIRTIDWKAFARTDRYFIKLFEKETDMNCYLLVDKSASMGYGGQAYKNLLPTSDVSKLDYAFYLTASLSYLMVKQGDKVSLSLFDTKLTKQIPPGGTFPHLYQILHTLERQKAGERTSISRILQEAYPLYKRRGLLIVISDFLDEPEEIFRALDRYRHRRFEIILFHVLHEYEYELPPLDRVKFVDAETGEAIASRPADIRKSYNEEVRRFVQTLRTSARARNIDYHLVTTDTPYSDVLREYLLNRSSR
jgi:uncharacterized protein (DUF58 family)